MRSYHVSPVREEVRQWPQEIQAVYALICQVMVIRGSYPADELALKATKALVREYGEEKIKSLKPSRSSNPYFQALSLLPLDEWTKEAEIRYFAFGLKTIERSK